MTELVETANTEREGGRSNTRTNWTFSWLSDIGETGVGVSFILNENYHGAPEHLMPNLSGSYMEQLSAEGLPRGADGNKIPHATMENIYVGYDNYVLSEGRVFLSAEWADGEITEEQIDAYVNWLQTENFGLNIENIQRTDTSVSWEQETHDETGGPYSLIRYQPNSQFKITIISDVISMACFLRPENQGHLWNTCSYSILAGDTLTINKQGSECYVAYVGEDFVTDGNPVDIGTVCEVTTNQISVTNNSPGTRKIGMIWQ